MNQKLQVGLLLGFVMLSVPLSILLNGKSAPVTTDARAEQTNELHSSFDMQPGQLTCVINDTGHADTLKTGERLTLQSGIKGGSGAYTLKWKTEDKDRKTSALDADGIGTFADTGTPTSRTNPTVWFAPSTFRDTKRVVVKLTVSDSQNVSLTATCAKEYSVQ